MKVIITDTQDEEIERLELNNRVVNLNQDAEINQSEYMLLLDQTVTVDGLPIRKYDIKVIDMTDALQVKPEPEESEGKDITTSDSEEAYAKSIASEFEVLEIFFNQAVALMRKNQDEEDISTEAAMNAATALYINTKKEMQWYMTKHNTQQKRSMSIL